jgi:hypothetical protein
VAPSALIVPEEKLMEGSRRAVSKIQILEYDGDGI